VGREDVDPQILARHPGLGESHVFGQCGNGVINYHTETYPVGTGRFRAELDVKNQYGTVIDSYTYELVF
jgi:hypothetical protein